MHNTEAQQSSSAYNSIILTVISRRLDTAKEMAVTVEKMTTERFSFEMREEEIVFDEGFVTVSIVEVAPACGRVAHLTMAIDR